MEYIVIKAFTDKDDKNHYEVGERYPHRGFAKKERVEELSTDKNRRGIPLIAPKEAEKEEKVEVEAEKAEPKKRSSKKK
jgi:hypothetical protein